MFAALLYQDDARRATEVIEAILSHGLRCALTGGLAIEARLRAAGRPVQPRSVNDIDFVVANFTSIPESLASSFLLNHVHPFAVDGKTVLQIIDQPRRLRVDLFRESGTTLSRAGTLDGETGNLDVLSVEDLIARTTAMVCGCLQRGRTIDLKHATAFDRLRGLGEPAQLARAWSDHRQAVSGTVDQALDEAARLLRAHPELIVVEEYSTEITPCEACREHGPFRPSPPDRIVQTLGYW